MYNQYLELLKTQQLRYYYQHIIDPVLFPYLFDCREHIDPEQLNNELLVLQTLLERGLINNTEHSLFLDKLNSGGFRYIYENNQWSFLNKLNTNCQAVPYVLINYLSDYHANNDKIKQSLELCETKQQYQQFINLVTDIISDKDNREIIYHEYIIHPKHHSNIVHIIQSTSRAGDNNEKFVVDFMKETGWNILYVGGNGRLIDQFFKIDIVGELDNTTLTLQVKPAQSIQPIQIPYLSNDTYYLIDLVDVFDIKSIHFNSLAFVTSRGDIVGFGKQQKYFKDSINKWRVGSQNDVFPQGNELLVCKNNVKFITPGLLSIHPTIY